MATKAKPVRHRKIYRDNIQGITKPSLQRLCREAGARRISGLIYEELRGILLVYLEDFLRQAFISMTNSRRKTLDVRDVEYALSQLGLAYGGLTNKACKVRSKRAHSASKPGQKKRRFKPGTESKREIEFYQKNSGCLIFSKAPFKRLVREKLQDYTDYSRVSEKGTLALQLAIEHRLKDIVRDAVIVADRDSHRETIMPKDLQVVREIKHET